MSDKRVLLVGGFHEMIELCEACGYTIAGIIDAGLGKAYYGYPVVGTDDDAAQLRAQFPDCALVLTPDAPAVRQRLHAYYSAFGFEFASVISPQARVSRFATLGKGVILQAGANVSAATHIGDFVKLNTYANVMHDSTVGDFTTIAPNAVVLGYVHVGSLVYVGANSTILPKVSVQDKATVGAGAVVAKDVSSGLIVKGVRAK